MCVCVCKQKVCVEVMSTRRVRARIPSELWIQDLVIILQQGCILHGDLAEVGVFKLQCSYALCRVTSLSKRV